MIDTVVHVLLVILRREEEEQLVAVLVEIRLGDNDRTADLEPWIEVLRLGLRRIWLAGSIEPSVVILPIIGIRAVVPVVNISFAVEALAARFADSVDDDGTFGRI